MIMSQGAAQTVESGGGASMQALGTEAPTLIGATLDGAYRITRLIAEGGMSTVYEAVQLRLDQRVAVKVMARELASNQEALARFRREAEITSRLRHPHLVTIMDFGTAPASQPYLVMEYLEGIDLDHRIRELGRLPLPAVVHITKQLASALGAAHDQGIVHRDLKPANVFLVKLAGEPDFAKILDFGISKVRAANTQLTKASAIIGTPNYMSPEQATGMIDEIDHRTDQWALACIVWEMLSGRSPFASDDMSAVFYQVIHLDPGPLAKRAPDLPPAVESVLRRALSKSMTDRFPSMRDFANALESAACGRPAETTSGAAWVERRRSRPERRRSVDAPFWRRIKPIYALSAVTAALVVAALVPLRWNKPEVAAAPPVAATAAAATPTMAARPVASESKSKQASLEEAGARATVRAAKHKGAGAAAVVPHPADPFAPSRRPVKHPPTKAGRHVDDSDNSIDPFAPTRPASNQQPPKARKADTAFANPFGP
jgi:serine/threonine protein kinase